MDRRTQGKQSPRATWFGVAAIGLLSAACTDLQLESLRWEDHYDQSPTLEVDVLFVVDNSLSMQGPGQEQERVIQAFDDFLVNLKQNQADFHIGITTMDMDTVAEDGGTAGRLKEVDGVRYITSDMTPEEYRAIFEDMIRGLGNGPAKEKGLWAAKTALYPARDGGEADGWNAGFLRKEAKLAVIFVSDEDDCSDEGNPLEGDQVACYTNADELRPVFEYIGDFLAVKSRDEDVVVSAIVGPEGVDNDSECGANSAAGKRYLEVTRETGGVAGSICESNFSNILYQMGLSAAGVRTHFVLSRPARAESIEVDVDGVEIPLGEGWIFDDETNAVDFYGDAIPPRDAHITITYLVG